MWARRRRVCDFINDPLLVERGYQNRFWHRQSGLVDEFSSWVIGLYLLCFRVADFYHFVGHHILELFGRTSKREARSRTNVL
jgi:hypothetical protein